MKRMTKWKQQPNQPTKATKSAQNEPNARENETQAANIEIGRKICVRNEKKKTKCWRAEEKSHVCIM